MTGIINIMMRCCCCCSGVMAVPGEDSFCCQIIDNDMTMGRMFNAPTRGMLPANKFSAVLRSLIHRKLEKRSSMAFRSTVNSAKKTGI